MKVTCSQSDLSKGVSVVTKAVPSRTTMPILQSVLIDATANQIKLVGNDMEIGIETIIPGTILERGMIALDAKFFSDIIRNLPNGDVTITTNEATFQTKIQCGKEDNEIPGKQGGDFPLIPVIPRNQPLVIPQFRLKDIIRQTIFSTSENDPNRLMSGELFEIAGDKLRVVSLDGHRVSIRNVVLAESYVDQKVIVPAKTLNELSKIMNGSPEDMVNIFITENHIIFEFDETTVVSQLLEGEFFRIDHMLSKDYETKVTLKKQELLDIIAHANLYTSETDKKPIIMSFTDQKLDMEIKSARGRYNSDMDVMKEGRDIKIGFNPKFFIDALRVIDDETITLYMISAKTPCFIRDDAETYNYLILPVNFAS